MPDERIVMTKTIPQWQVEGTLLIACNCDYGCPCNFNALPTTGDCEGMWSWHVDRGRFGDTVLDGLHFSALGDYPGAIHEGDGVQVRWIDARADDVQRDALATLLSGEAGGPWGIFAKTLAEVHGPFSASYEYDPADVHSRLKVGDAVQLALEPIRNPVTGAEVHPGAVLPEGLVCKEMRFASSAVFRVDDTVNLDHSGKYAAVAPFRYDGPGG